MSIKKRVFGMMPDDREVELYRLENRSGASVEIITLGGALRCINVPDAAGVIDDVICGYDTVGEYLRGDQHQGALIGRFANRIKEGRFSIGGREYQVSVNDGKNSLHGGREGFTYRVWDVVRAEEGDGKDLLELSIHSPDGDMGFPGNLDLNVTYTFDDKNALSLDYRATADRDTVVNFTNHAYFNLSGFASCDVAEHEIRVAANYVTETDSELIPTGKLIPVGGTEYDLRAPVKLTGYFDDNFVLADDGLDTPAARPVCEVSDPETGRAVRVLTTLPGIQIYCGCMMSGGIPFKQGRPSFNHCAFCLETQRWPDSPNHPNFTDCVLRAGEVFTSRTVYEFGVI